MTHSCTFLQSRVSCSQLWTIKPWSSDTSFLKLKTIKQKRSRRLAPAANRDALPKYFGSLVSLNKLDATNKKKKKKKKAVFHLQQLSYTPVYHSVALWPVPSFTALCADILLSSSAGLSCSQSRRRTFHCNSKWQLKSHLFLLASL